MLHITVSGIDKAGKTTLIKAFEKETNHRHYVVDRDPSNYFALSEIQNRVKNIHQTEDYINFKNKFKHSVDLAVYVHAPKNELTNRFAETNEPDLVGNYSFDEHMKIIKYYFDNVGYENVIILNTYRLSLDECVSIMINKIEEIENARK